MSVIFDDCRTLLYIQILLDEPELLSQILHDELVQFLMNGKNYLLIKYYIYLSNKMYFDYQSKPLLKEVSLIDSKNLH